MMAEKRYAELDSISNFSFLQGASHPEELIERAHALNLFALGIADVNSLAGIVRAHAAAKDKGVRLLVGARLSFADQLPDLIIYPRSLAGYQSLSRLLSIGKLRSPKGRCDLYQSDLTSLTEVVAIAVPPHDIDDNFVEAALKLRHLFAEQFYCAASFSFDGFSDRKLARLIALEQEQHISMVVTNAAMAHDQTRRPVADVLTCIKSSTTLEKTSAELCKNSERYLKSPAEMWRLFNARPAWLERSVTIAESINFSLAELRYYYPSCHDQTLSDQDYLVQESYQGAKRRYGEIPPKIDRLLQQELALVEELGYATYFLTVYDIVNFARTKGILCQGRGSAANSVICYCLGITEVDPNTHELLFGRFISKERNEAARYRC